MTTLRPLVSTLVCAIALAAPRLAQACTVCTAGREEETQQAFLWTTIFLSVLPLAMFGALFVWLRRKHQSRERAVSEQGPIAPIAADAAPTAL